MDFSALAAALKQKRPQTVQNQDLGTGMDNIKNAFSADDPANPANSGNPAPQQVDLQGAGPIQGGAFPAQEQDGDHMSGQVAQMQAANAAQAAQDPNMAAKLEAQRVAVQKFRDMQEQQQLAKLQGLGGGQQ